MRQHECCLGNTWVRDHNNPGHYYRLEDGLKREVPPKPESKKSEVDAVAIGITAMMLVLLAIALKPEPAAPTAPQPSTTSWSRGN